MNEQSLKLLEQLAVKLGTTAEFLWSVLVKQAYVSFWTDLLQYALCLVLFYITYRIIQHYRRLDKYSREEDFWAITSLISGCASVVLLITVLLSVPNTITKILNPEYWALQQILEQVK